MLVLAYGGDRMPPSASAMSVVPGQLEQKPLPKAIDPDRPPLVYSAPECAGTRPSIDSQQWKSDIEYLRAFRAGAATPSVRGRVTDNALFWISGFDPLPGLADVKISIACSRIRRSAPADAEGDYVIDNIPARTYVITPSLPPYVATRKALNTEVNASGCGTADFLMIAHGAVRGAVLDFKERPAAEIPVEVMGVDNNGKLIFYTRRFPGWRQSPTPCRCKAAIRRDEVVDERRVVDSLGARRTKRNYSPSPSAAICNSDS
jgi:hypothetical protein